MPARGRIPTGPRGLGEGPRGRPLLEGGGGGLLPARGTTGAPLERGGGGRACIARCRAMSIHGRAAWDYIPNPPRRSPFLGGLGGGGLAVVVCSHPYIYIYIYKYIYIYIYIYITTPLSP